MKRINFANILTTLRVVLIIPISAAIDVKAERVALGLYTVAALGDFFDGYVARRCGLQSNKGARYDAAADILFGIAIFAWLEWLFPEHTMFITMMFVALASAMAAGGIVSLFATRELLALHLTSSKVGTAALFLSFPIMLLRGYSAVLLCSATIVFLAGRVHVITHILKSRKERSGRQ